MNDRQHGANALPASCASRTEAALLAYMRHFALNFGAFDFIETPQGDFVFLECNPNGQSTRGCLS